MSEIALTYDEYHQFEKESDPFISEQIDKPVTKKLKDGGVNPFSYSLMLRHDFKNKIVYLSN